MSSKICMKSLYAPWRSTYSQDEERLEKEGTPEKDCPFCKQINAHDDEKYFILRRFEHAYVVFKGVKHFRSYLLKSRTKVIVPYPAVRNLLVQK